MKITKLDNFGEGFMVAPRKPHKETRTLGKPLSNKEKNMRIIDVVASRLEKEGACYVSCFSTKRKERTALDCMRRIQKNKEMNIEKVFDSQGFMIGYKVIKQ